MLLFSFYNNYFFKYIIHHFSFLCVFVVVVTYSGSVALCVSGSPTNRFSVSVAGLQQRTTRKLDELWMAMTTFVLIANAVKIIHH